MAKRKKPAKQAQHQGPEQKQGFMPWERLAGEPAQHYEKFCAYRDMRYIPAQTEGERPKLDITKERSIRGLAASLGVTRQALEQLSARFRWVERCEAYDSYILARLREKNEAEIIKMHETHAAIAGQMLKRALARLLTIPEDEITASDLVRLVDVGVKVECLSRGESTERREISGETTVHTTEKLDLSALTPDELRRLAAMGGEKDADV